jgi:7-keto-8-aminopelargonate synthetase-like enzyme
VRIQLTCWSTVIDRDPLAVVLTSPLIKSYLLNYARSLIYTTALSNAAVISVGCSFDMLEDRTAKKVCFVKSTRQISKITSFYTAHGQAQFAHSIRVGGAEKPSRALSSRSGPLATRSAVSGLTFYLFSCW